MGPYFESCPDSGPSPPHFPEACTKGKYSAPMARIFLGATLVKFAPAESDLKTNGSEAFCLLCVLASGRLFCQNHDRINGSPRVRVDRFVRRPLAHFQCVASGCAPA